MAEELRARITLTDNYTATMKNVTKATQQAKKEQENLQKAVNMMGANGAKAGTQASKAMSNVSNGAKKAKREVGALGDEFGQAADEAKGLSMSAAGLAGFVSLGYAAKRAWDGAMSAINLSAMQQVQETTFQALLNHKAAGSALYDYVSAYAKVSALGREDLANAVTVYSTYTKDVDQLERLIKLTERLYAKDPTQGAAGAVFAMRELLSGDTMSIKDRFNMGGFSGETIRNYANTGDIEGMLNYVDQMFNKFGATQEVVDANYDNLLTQTNIFGSNMKTAIAEAATPAMEELSATMRQLNADMDAGKFQPFINLMGNGMRLIGNLAGWVAENMNWLAPTIVGVGAAVIAYNGTLLILKGATTAVTAATAIMNVVTGAATGNFFQAAAGAAALVGGLAAIAAVSKNIDVQTGLDIETAKQQYANLQSELGGTSASLPVEVTNSSPIKVKGEVEIEEESLRYMLDIQGQQWLAKFSTATIAPQNNFYGTVIRETADFDEFTEKLTSDLRTATETAAAGVY